jgi:hypothetical protein
MVVETTAVAAMVVETMAVAAMVVETTVATREGRAVARVVWAKDGKQKFTAARLVYFMKPHMMLPGCVS